ncbi:hypothetical protein AWC32_16780 [Mycobacterium xenopi]|nr:hypothetical protein AWC32_16780 [Mycobacterium xenopi]
MPVTEHSAQILAGSWPSQSVTAWSGYEMEFTQAANNLFNQLNTQYDIRDILAPMEGAFIDAARSLEAGRETALQNRIEGYRYLAKQARWAANELHSTKADLVEIVNQAEEDIQAARDAAAKAEAAAAAIPGAAQAIEAKLQADIAAIVAAAKGKAQARDLQGATTVTGLSAEIGKWTVPFVNHTMPETGGGGPTTGSAPAAPAPAAPAPAQPAPQDGGAQAQPAKYGETTDNLQQAAGTEPSQTTNGQQTPDRQSQPAAYHKPDPSGLNQPGTSPQPATSSPSQGTGSLGSPGSLVGHMLSPISSGSGSSPASGSPLSSGMGSGLGNFGNPAANPAAAQGNPLAAPNASAPGVGATPAAAASGAGQTSGLASLGSGIAETSARMASGAVSGAANGLGAAANVGNQVAQNVAAGAAGAQAPAQAAAAAASNPAALTTPAAAGAGASGGASMAMMPPAGGVAGATPVTPVSGTSTVGPATPTTPAAAQPVSSSGYPVASSQPGAAAAPLAMPHQGGGIGSIGADGATGEALFEQAMDAGRDVIAAMMAQISGYIPIDFAVSLIWERTNTVTAWLATSEGASYIPLGVRVPQDVRLAVTDPVVGRQLWEATAASGGGDPLEVVARHAEAREMAAPGVRVLAIASTMNEDQVLSWASVVRARPVSVKPKDVEAAALDGHMLHRCQVAMPWEWRQANAFTEQDRLRIAARHMHMAANAGHLHGAACETVMRLFEERKPIDDELWRKVREERFNALVEFEFAMQARGQGGSEPARALATARAAEVIECLRHYDTAEGCADLLYATRLAGAPLSPAAAVA